MRVVLDTNIWVSSIVFGGRVRVFVETLMRDRHQIVISEELLTETLKVLGSRKIASPPGAILVAERAIRDTALVVRPTERLRVVKRDPDDDRVLECALSAGADVIVTGDGHLLALGEFRGIRILEAAAFIREFLPEGGVGISRLEEPHAAYGVMGGHGAFGGTPKGRKRKLVGGRRGK
jgi:putative PIN family toxin of toxin-antitoxin system